MHVADLTLPGTSDDLVRSYIGTLQSRHSARTVGESLARAARLLGAERPQDVAWTRLGLDDLNALRALLAGRYAPATANLTLSAVRQLLKVAHVLGLTSSQQRAMLDFVKPVVGVRLDRGRSLSRDEELLLRRAARQLEGHAGIMFDALIGTCIGAGLRREEACRMSVRAYDQPARTLRVLGKGNKERELGVDQDMRRTLGRWLVLRGQLAPAHEALFCSPSDADRPLSTWSLWSVVRDLATETGVALSGPHDFRRTFATRLLEAGFDLREVQRMMGHANVTTTGRYDKRSAEELLERRREARILASEGDATDIFHITADDMRLFTARP